MIKKTFSIGNVSNLMLNIFLLLFVIFPTGYIFITSFCTADDLGNISLIFTTANYEKLFSGIYAEVLFNSVKIAFITTLLVLLTAFPLAYIISKLSKKLRLIMLLLMLLPYWTNSLVRTYSFMVILRTDGIINKLLISIGLTNEPLQLLYTEPAVIISMVYLFLPVMFLPIYSSVEKIDITYLEASKDLGAGKLVTFFRIILPLALPGIVAGSILVFTPCLGLFYISDLIGGGKNALLGNVIRDQFTATRNLPFGSALSVVMMLIALVFIIFYYRLSSGGETNEQ